MHGRVERRGDVLARLGAGVADLDRGARRALWPLLAVLPYDARPVVRPLLADGADLHLAVELAVELVRNVLAGLRAAVADLDDRGRAGGRDQHRRARLAGDAAAAESGPALDLGGQPLAGRDGRGDREAGGEVRGRVVRGLRQRRGRLGPVLVDGVADADADGGDVRRAGDGRARAVERGARLEDARDRGRLDRDGRTVVARTPALCFASRGDPDGRAARERWGRRLARLADAVHEPPLAGVARSGRADVVVDGGLAAGRDQRDGDRDDAVIVHRDRAELGRRERLLGGSSIDEPHGEPCGIEHAHAHGLDQRLAAAAPLAVVGPPASTVDQPRAGAEGREGVTAQRDEARLAAEDPSVQDLGARLHGQRVARLVGYVARDRLAVDAAERTEERGPDLVDLLAHQVERPLGGAALDRDLPARDPVARAALAGRVLLGGHAHVPRVGDTDDGDRIRRGMIPSGYGLRHVVGDLGEHDVGARQLGGDGRDPALGVQRGRGAELVVDLLDPRARVLDRLGQEHADGRREPGECGLVYARGDGAAALAPLAGVEAREEVARLALPVVRILLARRSRVEDHDLDVLAFARERVLAAEEGAAAPDVADGLDLLAVALARASEPRRVGIQHLAREQRAAAAGPLDPPPRTAHERPPQDRKVRIAALVIADGRLAHRVGQHQLGRDRGAATVRDAAAPTALPV